MSNLYRIVALCNSLGIPLETTNLYAGYKEILISLPDYVIEGLYQDGELGEAYENFCEEHGVYYSSDTECWVA